MLKSTKFFFAPFFFVLASIEKHWRQVQCWTAKKHDTKYAVADTMSVGPLKKVKLSVHKIDTLQ